MQFLIIQQWRGKNVTICFELTNLKTSIIKAVAYSRLPSIIILVAASTSDPVIKPRYDRSQYGRKLESCETRGRQFETLCPALNETRACT